MEGRIDQIEGLIEFSGRALRVSPSGGHLSHPVNPPSLARGRQAPGGERSSALHRRGVYRGRLAAGCGWTGLVGSRCALSFYFLSLLSMRSRCLVRYLRLARLSSISIQIGVPLKQPRGGRNLSSYCTMTISIAKQQWPPSISSLFDSIKRMGSGLPPHVVYEPFTTRTIASFRPSIRSPT